MLVLAALAPLPLGAVIQEQLRRWVAEAGERSGPALVAGRIPGRGSGCAGTQASTLAAADRVRALLLASGGKAGAGSGTGKRPIAV